MNKISRLKIEDNLHLEQLNISHADELFTLINKNRSYLRRFLPWLDNTKSISDTKIFIEFSSKDYKKLLSMQFVIIFNKKLIGMISLNDINKNNFKSKIGYWLDEDYTKKGIMLNSVKRLISYAFDELNLNKLEIHCATLNHRSNNIPIKLEFLKEGTLRDNEFLYDHFVDHNIYSLLRKDIRIKN